MPNRTNRNQTVLKEASFHLNYELNMLFISRVELSKAKNNITGAIRNAYVLNAILESFLMHTRNLIDFFYIAAPHRDDVVAEDFINNWETQRPPATELLNVTKSRANKYLAHLTYERRNFESPIWDFEEIERDLINVLRIFFEHVPEEKLCDEIIITRDRLNTLR